MILAQSYGWHSFTRNCSSACAEMAQFLQKNRISSFCCDCPVRTGTFTIGILELIGSIGQVISLLVPAEYENSGRNSNAVYGSQIASCVISFIVCLSLLWGVHKNSKDFLLPYIILRAISWFLVNILIGISLVSTFVTGEYILLLFVAIFIVVSVLIYYFWRCVVSFYLELTEQASGNRPMV